MKPLYSYLYLFLSCMIGLGSCNRSITQPSSTTPPSSYATDLNKLIASCEKMLLYSLDSKKTRSYDAVAYDKFYEAVQKAKNERTTEAQQFKSYVALLDAEKEFLARKVRNDQITFVGTGDIQKSLQKGDKIPANTGLGVTYERDFGNLKIGFSKLDLELSVNIASTVDSIIGENFGGSFVNRRDFGNSVLLPINSGQAGYFDLNVYFGNKPHEEARKDWFTPGIISGLNLNFIGSNRNWTRENLNDNVTTLALKFGAFKEFIPFHQQKDYSIKLGFHLTMNSVLGDAGQQKVSTEYFLGTSRRTFFGGEFYLGTRLKNIRAEIGLPMVDRGGNSHVPGLTGTRVVTRIRFTGGFPISLN